MQLAGEAVKGLFTRWTCMTTFGGHGKIGVNVQNRSRCGLAGIFPAISRWRLAAPILERDKARS
jgi:hypothetical protein